VRLDFVDVTIIRNETNISGVALQQ